ncbi:hypothetical protein A0257_03405 [Hymenobacter psoromatis]|nr:hypothetical protein A0257_03405 [Hymenobacter psoromatis]
MAGAAESVLSSAITRSRGSVGQFVVDPLRIAQSLQALPIDLVVMQVSLRHLMGSQDDCPWAVA